MSRDYFLEAATPLTARHFTAVRNWFASACGIAVHLEDHSTWFLFRDRAERQRRLKSWQDNPQKNDYLTSFVVVLPEGLTLSLGGDDVDRAAVALAEWWLLHFGGRLLDCGLEITPRDMMPDV